MEEAVLGAIMLEAGAFDTAAAILPSEQVFYVLAHQQIYRAMCELSLSGAPIDILTVVEKLRSMEQLDAVGGAWYVSQLTNNVVSSAHLEAHAKKIQEAWTKRETIRIGSEAVSNGFDDSVDAFYLLAEIEGQIFTLSTGPMQHQSVRVDTLIDKTMKQLAQRMQNKDDLTGVPTGFIPVDKLTGGWQAGDLIILAARPSVGKSAFALNLIRNAAMHASKPTGAAMFCLEMSKEQCMTRLLSAESEVKLEYIMNGTVTEQEYLRIEACRRTIGQANIVLDDTPAITIFQLRAKCRRLVKREGVGLIVIDYLQLMGGSENRNGTREQEVSKISRELKALARELKVPIIALSQLSRDVEKRKEGDSPKLSDLRESGAIEQDADIVMFLYRSDYQKEEHEVDPALAGDASVKWAKHRNGKLATLTFKSRLDIQRFESTQAANDQQRASTFISKKEAEARYAIEQPPVPDEDDMPF